MDTDTLARMDALADARLDPDIGGRDAFIAEQRVLYAARCERLRGLSWLERERAVNRPLDASDAYIERVAGLHWLRRAMGVSQPSLATLANLSVTDIGRAERWEAPLSDEALDRLEATLERLAALRPRERPTRRWLMHHRITDLLPPQAGHRTLLLPDTPGIRWLAAERVPTPDWLRPSKT